MCLNKGKSFTLTRFKCHTVVISTYPALEMFQIKTQTFISKRKYILICLCSYKYIFPTSNNTGQTLNLYIYLNVSLNINIYHYLYVCVYRQFVIIYTYTYVCVLWVGGNEDARGVMVIVVRNGHGYTGSNPGRG